MKKIVLVALMALCSVSVGFGGSEMSSDEPSAVFGTPSRIPEKNECVENCEQIYVIDRVENGLVTDAEGLDKCLEKCD